MKPKIAQFIVFASALLFNWKLISEDYSSGHLLPHWTVSPVGLFLAVSVVFSIVWLRRILLRIKGLLVAKGIMQKDEKIVNWRDAFIAPIPILLTFTYAWSSSSTVGSKLTLQYGGTEVSAFLYIILVAFLVFTQIECRLNDDGA